MRLRNTVVAVVLLSSLCLSAQTPSKHTDSFLLNRFTFANSHSLPFDPAADMRKAFATKILDGSGEGISEIVRDIFQQHGYFTADVEVLRTSTHYRSGGLGLIDVWLSITPGKQYRLKVISFNKHNIVSESGMRAVFPLQDGDIFNIEGVRQGIKRLTKLYGERGYTNFTAVPDTTLDPVAQTISISMDIDAGAMYTLDGLEILGEESVPGAKKRLLSVWGNFRGRPYTGDKFWKELFKQAGIRMSDETLFAFDVRRNERRHTIDLRLVLSKPVNIGKVLRPETK